eukprot:10594299-Heterocapsa_arctica.AAC.1
MARSASEESPTESGGINSYCWPMLHPPAPFEASRALKRWTMMSPARSRSPQIRQSSASAIVLISRMRYEPVFSSGWAMAKTVV